MDPARAFELAEIKRHRAINETIVRGDSRVQRFYDGAVVFITGGSGFLGKQLMEKLFRACNISKVYLLLRTKKNRTIDERLKKILEDPVYETVREMKPDFAEKIFPVCGDVSDTSLGIRSEDWEKITEEVTHIFHGAATINFVEPLKVAVMINLNGTMEMLKLGKACKNLKSFVHISTAYSHATVQRIKQEVMEKFYESPISPNVLLKLVQQLDKEKLDAMTPELIKNWPNTYAFTKAVAEEAVRTESENLPICIVRPAIVVVAMSEPVPGWIDKSCAFGPSGFILGVGLGVLHTLYRSKNVHLDIVPVDLVNNAVLTAAYDTAVRRERGETEIKIYTVTGTRSPVNFGEMSSVIRYDAPKTLMSDKAVYAGCCLETENKLLFMIATYLFHYIPGYIGDFILTLLRKKPIMTKLYDTAYKLNMVFGYFMTNDWKFSDSNLLSLYHSLSPADRIIFNSDISARDPKHYVLLWILGIRRYIVKDGLKNTKAGMRKHKLFMVLNPIVVSIYFYILYKIIYFIGFILYSLFSSFFG